MTFLLLSFFAGLLTVLAPCVLPLLPVIIGSSVGARSRFTPYIVIGALALSILLFTFLLKASTALITIPPQFWAYVSGTILTGFGLTLLWPKLWSSLSFIRRSTKEANQLVGRGHQQKTIWGDILVGAALGPVFSTCSPTYLVILATILPASFLLGTVYLLAYLAGLVLVLVLIALLGQRLTARLQFLSDSRGWFKRTLGLVFILIGLAIAFGFDKKLEIWVLDSGTFDITRFEARLLKETTLPADAPKGQDTQEAPVPLYEIKQDFPSVDWSKVDENKINRLEKTSATDQVVLQDPLLSIVPIQELAEQADAQVLVVSVGGEERAYPFTLLEQYPLINDIVAGVPIVVNYCPLCNTSVAYARTLENGKVGFFSVSGYNFDQNTIMYEETTKTLWLQASGQTVAGSIHPANLTDVSFFLSTIGEVTTGYPFASAVEAL